MQSSPPKFTPQLFLLLVALTLPSKFNSATASDAALITSLPPISPLSSGATFDPFTEEHVPRKSSRGTKETVFRFTDLESSLLFFSFASSIKRRMRSPLLMTSGTRDNLKPNYNTGKEEKGVSEPIVVGAVIIGIWGG